MHHVEGSKSRQPARGDPRHAARDQFHAVTGIEKLDEIGNQERDHRRAHETLNAELLARLVEQDAHARIGHVIGNGDPARICGRQVEMPLQHRQIGDEQAILETADDREIQADYEIADLAPDGMVRRRGRPRHDRAFVRLEHIGAASCRGRCGISHARASVPRAAVGTHAPVRSARRP